MILMFLVAMANAQFSFFKTDNKEASTAWERNEAEQAQLLLDAGLPAPICAEDNWSIGLRRVVKMVADKNQGKKLDLSNMTLSQSDSSKLKGLTATLCAIVTVRAAEKKADEKPKEETSGGDDKPAPEKTEKGEQKDQAPAK